MEQKKTRIQEAAINHEAAPNREAAMNQEADLNPDQLAELAEKQAEEETVCCGSGRHKKRTPEEGLEKMVENNAYCPDILIQSSAAASALNSFNKTLLGCHIRGCVAEDIRNGRDETVDELCNVLQKLMK